MLFSLSISAKEAKKLPSNFKYRSTEYQYNDRTNFPAFMVFAKGQNLKVELNSNNWSSAIFGLNEKEDLISKSTSFLEPDPDDIFPF